MTGVTGGRSVMTSGTGTKKGKGKRKQKGEGSVRSGAKATGDEGSTVGQAADDEEEDDAEVDTELIHDGELVDRDAAKKNLR